MIHLERKLLDELHQPGGLHTALQRAIELEHATLPTYLYAYYSLGTDGVNNVAFGYKVLTVTRA